MLNSLRNGKTQLPDFQRGWVWEDERIRGLLTSVSQSFPIGAVMMLQTGNTDVRFKPRLVEGVKAPAACEPERFILDGQQRLTALYLSLLSGQPVKTRDARGGEITRWYYLNIEKTLSPNGDRDDAIVGVPEDKVVRNFRGEVVADYSTIEKECAAGLLPLSIVFDTAALTKWQMVYLQEADPSQVQERLARWNALLQSAILRIQQYHVPLIQLRKETPKEAVCSVFEKVNTRGCLAHRLRTADCDVCGRRLQPPRRLGFSQEALHETGAGGRREYRLPPDSHAPRHTGQAPGCREFSNSS